ncbi:uncharacterized protein LOC126769034 [Nymphalis io]|uniref:uncharacterized protein LOC126769034 n=1 Tax=Inachis io TaxID=171585 RepID=UPI00216A856F|nr:uncharacterized protein LOC126769034 [Nymphalis io]
MTQTLFTKHFICIKLRYKMFHPKLVVLILSSSVLSCLAGDIVITAKEDHCRTFTSCSSCISQNICTWCVTKSLCTKQLCGNDNVIYPSQIPALMSGPDFCPRVAEKKELTFASGQKDIITVKITQIYLYMAFTPWKCEIDLNGEDIVLPAVLIGDTVFCESFEMTNKSENPYVEGNVKVLWNYNKAFDGSLPFKVCRCDLEPNCVACKNGEK